MIDLFKKTGKMAIGSRLRLLTSQITEDAAKIYELYNVNLTPKWFPVFFALSENEEKTITEIAQEIGHSQPSVTKIIKEMTKANLIKSNLKSEDKRRNVVALTSYGEKIAKEAKIVFADVEQTVEQIHAEASHNLWEAISEWEYLIEQKSLVKRVQEQKKARESKDVRIVDYTSEYKTAFKTLNEEWISEYFELEDTDRKALDNPEGNILQKGGKILVALYHDQPVGVCALIKSSNPDYDFEMAKMAVSPKAQGKSIGWLLGRAITASAKEMGAKKIYLEGNTLLKASINLYHKLGFQKITGIPSPYKRVNIQMELDITNLP